MEEAHDFAKGTVDLIGITLFSIYLNLKRCLIQKKLYFALNAPSDTGKKLYIMIFSA